MLLCPNQHLMDTHQASPDCDGELRGKCVQSGKVHETISCKEGCIQLCDKCCTIRRMKHTGLTVKGMQNFNSLIEDRMMEVLHITNTCPNGHCLEKTQETDLHSDWLCDGSADAGGCTKKGDTGRFVCEICNFDLCEICLTRRKRIILVETCSDPVPSQTTVLSPLKSEVSEDELLFLQAMDSDTESDEDQTPCESDVSTTSMRDYHLIDSPVSQVSSGSPRCQVIKDSIPSVSRLCDAYK